MFLDDLGPDPGRADNSWAETAAQQAWFEQTDPPSGKQEPRADGADSQRGDRSVQAAAAQPDPMELVLGPAGLGSDDFRQREAAHAALRLMGLRALPGLVRGLASDDAEIVARSRNILQELTRNNFAGIVGAVGDRALGPAAELALRQISTSELLDWTNQNGLTGREFQTVARIVRSRLTADELERLYIPDKRTDDEQSLRRAITVSDMIHRDARYECYRLGSLLEGRGNAQEAQRLLERVTSVPDGWALGAHMQLSAIHFGQGRNDRGIQALESGFRVLQHMSRNIGDGGINFQFTDYLEQIGDVRQRAAQLGLSEAQVRQLADLYRQADAAAQHFADQHRRVRLGEIPLPDWK